MSILTTIALMAGSFAAKIRQIKPNPMDVEIARLQVKVNELKAKIDDLDRERDSWYELMQAWRSRYYELRDAPRVTQQRPTPQSLQQDYTVWQAHRAMQCQNAQAMQNVFHQGLGAQIEQFVCNCVPARHDLFLRG